MASFAFDEQIRRRLSPITEIGTQALQGSYNSALQQAAARRNAAMYTNAQNSASANYGYSQGSSDYGGSGKIKLGNSYVDQDTWKRVQLAGKALGYNLPLMQGSWSHSVAASGGTHDGSGVIDLGIVGKDWRAAEAALRSQGLIAYWRTPQQGFSNHLHVINPTQYSQMARNAQYQVKNYLSGLSGLKGNARDTGTRQYDALIRALVNQYARL